jgi:amino acid transporter
VSDEEDQRPRRSSKSAGRRRDPDRSQRVQLEERTSQRGRLPGDRYVRIVRPSALELKRVGHGELELTEKALEPETRVGRWIETVRRFFIGRRLRTEAESLERVSKKTGLGLFASDNISSSAYATEEIMRVLAIAGIGALNYTEPLALVVIVVLAVVIVAELRVIYAYPRGGGSYQVATENLGILPGLVAAAALLIDYTLTIAVSTAAGVAALSSAVPGIHEHRVLWAVGLIAFVALINLRGVRESGLVFSGPTYLYIAGFVGLIGYGLFLAATGSFPEYAAPADWSGKFAGDAGFEVLGLFLILRAFSSGAVGLTGTEAIANSVPAFKPPEPRNAAITLIAMGTIFATIFAGLSFLSGALDIVPDPAEAQTVNSQLARALVGETPYYFFIQGITAILLLLAANTAFSGFPRLASILARDRFMPRQFALRGDRLAYSTGIVAVGAAAAGILAAFGGSVTALIPLYTIGVFVAFTLSQSGLVRRWHRLRNRGWRVSMAVNAFGAVVTGVVAIIVATTKFEHGAWMVIAVMPIIVGTLYAIHRHYRSVEDALVVTEEAAEIAEAQRPIVVIPVSRLDRATLQAVAFARGLASEVSAVHISDDPDEAKRLRRSWDRWIGDDVPLQIVKSPYRILTEPILTYLDAVDKHDPRRPVTVILAEFVPRRWWEYILHNQTALRLKVRLFFRPNTIVVDVPYHLADRDRGKRVS